MRVSIDELPVSAQTGDYTGAWAELGDMHYAFETCAAGYDMDALQLTRKSEHHELVRKFAAAGLFPSE